MDFVTNGQINSYRQNRNQFFREGPNGKRVARFGGKQEDRIYRGKGKKARSYVTNRGEE